MVYRNLMIVLFFLCGMSLSIAAQDEAKPPGRIAYIGTDYNVYTLNLHADQTAMLTDDARHSRRYQWPTWATNGKLAYFCCDAQFSTRTVLEVFVSDDGIEEGELIVAEQGSVFTYAYWSPADCDGDEGCRDLALLSGQPNFFGVDLYQHTEEDVTAQHVGIGSPFYYSWSPDGTRMVLQRNNRRYEIYEVAADSRDRLDVFPGGVQAPAWSPVDDRLLLGTLTTEGFRGRLTTDLIILDGDERLELLTQSEGLISYNWSPNGQYVAYRVITDAGPASVNVVDVTTGDLMATSSVDRVIAFFWSPDSEKLAIVAPDWTRGSFNASAGFRVSNPQLIQQQSQFIWSILDITNGVSQPYTAFQPTGEMIYLLNFFDQFAQSHQLWSPDSNFLVYAEINEDGEAVISVLDIAQPDALPLTIADGVIGIWSYH